MLRFKFKKKVNQNTNNKHILFTKNCKTVILSPTRWQYVTICCSENRLIVLDIIMAQFSFVMSRQHGGAIRSS